MYALFAIWLISLLLKSVDVHPNPGPTCSLIPTTEAHLGIDFQMTDINFEGFHSPAFKNRTDSGGGVIIYSKSELSIKGRPDSCHPRLTLV